MRKTLLMLFFMAFCLSSASSKSKLVANSDSSSASNGRDRYNYLMDSAKISKGVFNVFQDKENFYFEIHDSLLNRDLLVVNRVLRVPYELNDAGINRGINYSNTLIRFELSSNGKNILIRNVRPMPHYPQNDQIAYSIRDNFISPLMGSLKIEGYNSDSTNYIIKASDLFGSSVSLFNDFYNAINVGGSLSKDLSRITRVKAFDSNVAIISELSTKLTEGYQSVYLTVETISSIVLLPKEPKNQRYLSSRVGYFTVPYSFYSDKQSSVERKEVITRWRLEPKDKEAYLRGELVEPVKPIVFYLDESTPEHWRKYMKKGIEDWQVAFEKAGFKNAILAKEFTPEIDRDNIEYSSITYVASEKMNAMGPSVYDPRSGEIIQADIIWWHNVLSMLRSWIIVQTGAVQDGADSWNLSEELMGEAIRFVACHEVGHSLGLRHNMIASAAFPTDSLRSNEFVKKWGTSASIMDYSRFNYIAQPQDGVKEFAPKIGVYDLLAIEYGYRWFGKESAQMEVEDLNQILKAHSSPMYRYSEAQDARMAMDPRAQTEDLGDDLVKASSYGIENLKRLVPKVLDIVSSHQSFTDQQMYANAGRLYYAIISHWNNLVYHPLGYIGGIMLDNSQIDGSRKAYTFVDKQEQIAAFNFLMKETVIDVDWLFNNDISRYTFPIKDSPTGLIENAPSLLLKNAQSYIFWDLLDNRRLIRMSENEQQNADKAFTPAQLMDMLFDVIFKNVKEIGVADGKNGSNGRDLTVYQRSVQKGLVDALIQAVSNDAVDKRNKSLTNESLAESINNNSNQFAGEIIRNVNFYGSLSIRISDAISAKRGLLLKIQSHARRNMRRGNSATNDHFSDIYIRINTALK